MPKPFTVKAKVEVSVTPRPDKLALKGTDADFDNLPEVEDLEMRMFRNASHFTVARKAKRIGRQDVNEYQEWEFPQAMQDAYHDHRALLYAVTARGRCVPLVRCVSTLKHKLGCHCRWIEYLKDWAERHGIPMTRSQSKVNLSQIRRNRAKIGLDSDGVYD